MGGKASILLVLGFSLIFLIFGSNYGRLGINSMENFSNYYDQAIAYNLAVSGANMAANEIFRERTWDVGYTNLPLNGGFINVTVSNPLSNLGNKTLICHIPPGNPENRHSIWVGNSAVAAHLAHGDFLGGCDANPKTNQIIQVISEAVFRNAVCVVTAKFQPSKFSKFAYFSITEGNNIYWMSRDTVWGPFHTNGTLRVAGRPVFNGKVTINGQLRYQTNRNVDKPQFNEGFEDGVNIPIPSNGVSDLSTAASTGGKKFMNKDSVYLNFQGDSLKYRFRADTAYRTAYLPTFAPNGVIFVDNGTAYIKGLIKGKYTLGCSGTQNNRGKVYIEDDITYSSDPRTNPFSQDMFGIVAKRNVLIKDNAANQSGDINIMASIYSESEGFAAQNYQTRPAAGAIKLLGGIIQNNRGAVGTFSGNNISTGYAKRYRYDERLRVLSPPFFPGTGMYEIISWYETVKPYNP